MLFNSIEFLIYLPIVTLVYFALRRRERRVFLLAASFYFYAVFSWKLSILMVWASVLDYVCARQIGASENPRTRKVWLVVSLIGNLGTLATFKYLDFFSNTLLELGPSGFLVGNLWA